MNRRSLFTRLPRYIPELDGVRAIAVLMVMLMHVFTPDDQSRGALENVAPRVLPLLIAHGWLGVDLFFVLSGFLITGILLDTRDRVTYFHDFWLRRALRILPLVFTVVGILTVI